MEYQYLTAKEAAQAWADGKLDVERKWSDGEWRSPSDHPDNGFLLSTDGEYRIPTNPPPELPENWDDSIISEMKDTPMIQDGVKTILSFSDILSKQNAILNYLKSKPWGK